MQSAFLSLVQNRFRFNLFLLLKLPAAYFSGVRVKNLTETQCAVTVPYKWFSTNPFNSTYFACLAMAAEMSTGVLALGNTYKRTPAVSMLVTGLQGNFFKKATGVTTFTCEDGLAFAQIINEVIATRSAATFTSVSVGVNNQNEPVANFSITWSFKCKA